MNREQLHELAQQLRVDSVRAAAAASSGHPTSSMSAADLMAVLFARHLRYDFSAAENPANDHLVFSKGHASPLLYSLYKMAGAIDDEELLTFREFGSRLQGHPTPEIPWVDVATGSLGQGLPIAVGIALAGKRLESADFRVWVLCGDSELAEGSMWEAFEHAGHAGLDNMVAIVDVNRLGQRGPTMHEWDTSSLAARAAACGWDVQEIDGHDPEAIDAAYARAAAAGARRRSSPAPRRAPGSRRSRTSRTSTASRSTDPEAAVEELGGDRSLRVEVQSPPRARPLRGRRGSRSSGPPTRSVRRSRPAAPTATLSPGSARSTRRSSRSTARSATRPTPNASPPSTPTASSRCTSPSSRWSPPRSGCRPAAGSLSPPPLAPSSAAPTTSSAWPRYPTPT